MAARRRHIPAQPRAATACSGGYSSATAHFDAKNGVLGEVQKGTCKHGGTIAPTRLCTSSGWAVMCDKCTAGDNKMKWWHYLLIVLGALLLIMVVLGVIVAVVHSNQKRSAQQATLSVATATGGATPVAGAPVGL